MWGTRVNVLCPICGEVEIAPTQVRILGGGYYQFHCHLCWTTHQRRTTEEAIEELLWIGLPPPITEEDVARFLEELDRKPL